MVNPFSFSFFGPVLDHFICESLSSQAHNISLIYCLVFIFLVGPCLMILVIYLDENSFKDIFKAIQPISNDDHGLMVEIIDVENN